MLTAQYFGGDGRPAEAVPPDQVDSRLHGRAGVLWLEVSRPTDGDLRTLEAEFGFHPLAMEDLRQRDQRPRVAEYGDYIFMVVHEWQPAPGREDVSRPCVERRAEINAFVGPNYVVTVCDDDSEVLKATRRRWESNAEMQRQGPYFLLYLLLDSLVDDYFPALDAYDERIDTLEQLVLRPLAPARRPAAGPPDDAPDDAPLAVLLDVRRDLLEMRRNVAPLRDAVNVLLRRVEGMEDDEGADAARRSRARALFAYFQDVYDHSLRAVETIDAYRDLLAGTLNAHLAVASNRLNEVVKVLTSASIILMTWATISGIYGMNFTHMPELHWRYGYPYALGLMALTGGAEWVYFRRRDWL